MTNKGEAQDHSRLLRENHRKNGVGGEHAAIVVSALRDDLNRVPGAERLGDVLHIRLTASATRRPRRSIRSTRSAAPEEGRDAHGCLAIASGGPGHTTLGAPSPLIDPGSISTDPSPTTPRDTDPPTGCGAQRRPRESARCLRCFMSPLHPRACSTRCLRALCSGELRHQWRARSKTFSVNV